MPNPYNKTIMKIPKYTKHSLLALGFMSLGASGLFDNCATTGATGLTNPRAITITSNNDFAYIANFRGTIITECPISGDGNLSSCVAAYQSSLSLQLNGIGLNALKEKLYASDFNSSYLIECDVAGGGGLTCIESRLADSRAGGLAANVLGTHLYVMITDARAYSQCALDTQGLSTGCSGVTAAPTNTWDIALIE